MTPEEQVVIEVSGYPFVRCVVMAFDGDGSSEVLSWRPGIDYLFDGSDGSPKHPLYCGYKLRPIRLPA